MVNFKTIPQVRPYRLLLRSQTSEAQVIDDIFDFLDTIFDAIRSLAEGVVLEVQNLESSMDVLDELCDLNRTRVITLSHAVAGKTCLSMELEHSYIQCDCADSPARQSERSMIANTPRWADGRHLCP